MEKQLYKLANIRELLTRGFDEQELRLLCFDVPDFRPVYDRLPAEISGAEIAEVILEFAERKMQINTLLALARERNPARYKEHGPYYYDDPTEALQDQVSDLARRLAALTLPTQLTREQQYQIALHWVELGRKDSLKGFDLSEADLEAADLRGADLRKVNLQKAKLHLADLSRADLRLANLNRANLCEADLRGVNLRGADLGEADLGEADLGGTGLIRADRIRTGLIRADLRGADLGEADLGEANLSETNLSGVDLRRAKSNSRTTWPDGFNPQKAGVIIED